MTTIRHGLPSLGTLPTPSDNSAQAASFLRGQTGPGAVPDLHALGVEIARLRRDQGMSIDRLAEAAGVHRKTIIEVEAGRVAAKISTLHGIAHALGTPLPEIVVPVCARQPKSVRTPTPII